MLPILRFANKRIIILKRHLEIYLLTTILRTAARYTWHYRAYTSLDIRLHTIWMANHGMIPCNYKDRGHQLVDRGHHHVTIRGRQTQSRHRQRSHCCDAVCCSVLLTRWRHCGFALPPTTFAGGLSANYNIGRSHRLFTHNRTSLTTETCDTNYKNDTIRYDSAYLTCSKTRGGSRNFWLGRPTKNWVGHTP